ncbi:hypothetical protein [Legionella sp. km772]|uniref:hypothetical protein n=1 Tax=Legionella sp. km772 TaxID=2498111 RepID=UPI000F8D649B|nr:hypothetical protein [Legionella sp. km772]RUR06386.1 hypothetical protein ELY15_13260 [Legionella sp. km772]
MLYDKEILAALDKQVSDKYPHFNIQIFLHLLQSTTRPLGYPPFREGPKSDYYLNLIKENISSAKRLKNGERLHCLMSSLYQVMICFCYLQHSLTPNAGLSAELLALLKTAIEQRIDTTDEERCAEKSLLQMLLERPTETIQLIAEYHQQLFFVDIAKLLKTSINACGTKQLKLLLSSELTSAIELVEPTSQVLEVVKSADKGLKQFNDMGLIGAKTKRQLIIGFYLLDNIENAANQSWINDNAFLKTSRNLALQERGKNEAAKYIAAREGELALFSIFGRYSKATKLRSADKYFKALNNEKNIVFSQDEREALQDDQGSRLTDIYTRYKSVMPVA